MLDEGLWPTGAQGHWEARQPVMATTPRGRSESATFPVEAWSDEDVGDREKKQSWDKTTNGYQNKHLQAVVLFLFFGS